jgi:magnesium-transporting ATPase (P-type)
LTQPIPRPLGVTIIAILTIIGGVLLIFGGLSLLAFGVFFTAFPIGSMISEQQQQQLQPEIQNQAKLEALSQFLGSIGIVIGAIVLAVGIGYLVVSYGLLKGKGWAWTVTVILTIIAIVIQIISVISASMFNASIPSDTNALVSGIIAHIIGIAINGVILYYLYRPNVKAYFGKSQPSTTIQR